jgi:MarR-like DNA-binding transcriptional regulator SgrR of sgrS sRNA
VKETMGRSLCFLLLFLLGMAGTSGAGRLPRYGGNLRLEIDLPGPAPWTPDPLKLWGDDGALLGASLYEGLARWGPKRVEPGLAVRWYHDDEFVRWLFELRETARFHDGSRCDAQAVSESLHRLANPRASRHAWILRDLLGWNAFTQGSSPQIEGIVVLSPTEIELRMQRPVPDLPARLALPAAAITRRTGQGLFGTGPFRAAAATTDSLHALPFDAGPGGRPFLDTLDFVTDVPRTLALLRRTVSRADPRSVPPVGMARMRVPARRLALCLFHPESPATRDAGTRQHIVSSFDASVFVRAALGGDGEPAQGLWPAGSTVAPLTGSLEPARNSFEGTLRILVAPGDPTLALLGERLQLHLSRLGFTATLQQGDAAAFRRALRDHLYDLVVLGWTPLQGHPEDCSESTRVLHLLSHLLQPVLGSHLPAAWREMLAALRPASESALRQATLLAPIVYFHDLWQFPDTVDDLRPSTVAPRLDLQDVHVQPSIP